MISVLYVDDESSLLDLGKRYLEHGGQFSVDTAESAEIALNKIKNVPYDAIVSDYQMPVMDGIEFLTTLRKEFPYLPFIIFTGKGREEVVIEAFERGADYYLQKGGAPKPQFTELAHKIKLAVQLRQDEKNYRTVLENIQDVFYRGDTRGNLIMASPSWAKVLGYDTLEECIGKNIPDTFYYNPADRQLFLREIALHGAVCNYEITLKRKDGTPVIVSTSSHRYFDDRGNVIGVEGIFRDISAQKEAEYQLKKSRQYLQAIVQGSPVPTFVIDRRHQVVSWNKALEDYSGIPSDQIVGKPEAWRAFYPAKRPCMADLVLNGEYEEITRWYKGKFAASTLIEGGYEATDFFPGIKGGSWLFFTAAPIHDTNGQIIGVVEILQDITERILAEDELARKNEELFASYEQITASNEELQQNYNEMAKTQQWLHESEQRYRGVVEDQTEFICRFTPDGRLTFVNDAYCRYFGLIREKCIGKPHAVILPDEDAILMKNHLAGLTPDTPIGMIEHRIMMPSGEVRWQHWSDRAIFDSQAHIIEYQSVGRDTTAHKQVEEALRQANRQLKILTSITRHDILNKVAVLRGYISLAEKSTADPGTAEFIRKLESVTQDIQDQIESTRLYQDIGEQEPQWQEIENVAVRHQVPGTISLSIETGQVWVFADPMFEKVFFNLLDNSIRHGQHVTAIKVSSTESEEGLTIAWEDNGVGVPTEEKERIFERGYGKNTGLGLFLAREILAITGITIHENGEPGKGARFHIDVPKGGYRVDTFMPEKENGR